jgi:hypothetical protein
MYTATNNLIPQKTGDFFTCATMPCPEGFPLNVSAERFSVLIHIWKGPGSNLDPETGNPDVIIIFLNTLHKHLQRLELVLDQFVAHSFQCIIY